MRKLGIDLHAAAEELVRVEASQHHLRIRDGRLGAAAAVARGPRVGARRARTHAKRTALVYVCDRSAACAHRRHVDHGREYRIGAHVGVARVHDLDLPIGNRAEIG
jgi:hypothetical protein